jgi:hypothetical protein
MKKREPSSLGSGGALIQRGFKGLTGAFADSVGLTCREHDPVDRNVS